LTIFPGSKIEWPQAALRVRARGEAEKLAVLRTASPPNGCARDGAAQTSERRGDA
jgi:hypothetical protein